MRASLIALVLLILGGCVTTAAPGARVLTRDGAVMSLKLWSSGERRATDPIDRRASVTEGRVRILGVAAHPSGDAIVVGVADPRADLGLGSASHSGASQLAFLGRYAPDGKTRWLRVLDAAHPKVAVSPGGDIAFSADARRTGGPKRWGEGFGAESRLHQSRTTIAVLREDGQIRWHLQMKGPKSYTNNVHVARLSFGPGGALLVAGALYGREPAWGDGTKLSVLGGSDIFVAKLGPNGALAWHRVLGGPGYDVAEDAAWTPQGDIVVAGAFERESDLGGSRHRAKGNHDAFVLKVRGADGAPVWERVYGTSAHMGAQESKVHHVAVRADGELFVAASLNTSMPWGEKFAALGRGGSARSLVARLGPGGKTRWVRVFQGEKDRNVPRALTLDASGAPVVALELWALYGDAYFSAKGQVFRNVSGEDAILARIREDGQVAQVMQWGGRGERENQEYGNVWVSALTLWGGHVMAVGAFDGDVELAGRALRAPHGKIDPCQSRREAPAVVFAMQPPPDPCETQFWGSRVGFLARLP